MYRKKLNPKEMKALVLKVVADCRGLANEHIRNWQPFNENWPTLEGAVYLRLSDDTQVAVERGSLEQQIHIAISEAVYRSEQERMNYRITEFYIEPGITGTHGNRPEFIQASTQTLAVGSTALLFLRKSPASSETLRFGSGSLGYARNTIARFASEAAVQPQRSRFDPAA